MVAAGQPAPIIANMKPEAQKSIKFLKFDPKHPSSKQPLSIYVPSVVRASSYPNILTEDFTTIAVGAFLVTYDYNLQTTVEYLTRFARSLCQNFSTLRAKGHPKMARSESRAADAQQGLDLLRPDGARVARVHRRWRGALHTESLHGGRAHSRLLQVVRLV